MSMSTSTLPPGETLLLQLFVSPTIPSANAIFLAFYIVVLFLAILRFRTAPALGLLILFIVLEIIIFSLRVYEIKHDAVGLYQFRTLQALTALSLPILLETILVLVGEHFKTATELLLQDHQNSDMTAVRVRYSGLQRHALFAHLLSLLLFGSVVAAIYSAANLGSKDLHAADRAYIVLLFIFLGFILFHLLFRSPFLRIATTIFLFALTVISLVPVIYLELHFDGTTSWTKNSEIAFYILWCLPEALGTLGLIMVPIYTWYPDYGSRCIR